MAYDIGYRRPPVSTRFKQGKSGNPKGRPKGTSNFLKLLEKELAQAIVVNENGKKKTITRLQAMVKKMVAGALQGDHKAMLTLVEILRRTGSFEHAEVQSLVPQNHEEILNAYVERRQLSSGKKSQEPQKEIT